MNNKHESSAISYSPSESISAREEIFELLKSYPATSEEAERSLGLFLRGSLLARIFAIDEIYQKIVNTPGCIFDVGTWRGQTAVICENLRAIHEPLHFNRRIVAFDTFEGYVGFGTKDLPTNTHKDGTYKVEDSYDKYLSHLLELHEKSNAMGSSTHGKHKVIKGDCRETIANFFKETPNEFVSLAFMDVNAYAPTADSFNLIYKHLAPGGIIAFWQLTRSAIRAEGAFYNSLLELGLKHKVYRTKAYPGLCYLIKE